MMPHSSPCAPAAGDSASAGMPVRVFSQCAKVSISSSAPCTLACGLQRMQIGKAGQPRQLLVEPRVVLHRARAERVEAAVDRVVLLRQPGEMPHDLRLAEPGQADRPLPFEPIEARAERRRFRQIHPAMAGRILLEQERLLDLQPAVAADRLDRAGRPSAAAGALSAWLHSLIAAPP